MRPPSDLKGFDVKRRVFQPILRTITTLQSKKLMKRICCANIYIFENPKSEEVVPPPPLSTLAMNIAKRLSRRTVKHKMKENNNELVELNRSVTYVHMECALTSKDHCCKTSKSALHEQLSSIGHRT